MQVSKQVTLRDNMSQDEKLELVRQTVAKDATDSELQLFMHVCNQRGLDPFMKQVYFMKNKGSATIITGIDGYRLIAERTKRYAPGREPTFVYNEKKQLISATAYVKKQTADGTWHEIAATVFYDEYCKKYNGVPSGTWASMPHVMLAKCAEANALRRAFPSELSGLYVQEEMDQAQNIESVAAIAEPQYIDEAEQMHLRALIGHRVEIMERIQKQFGNDLSKILLSDYDRIVKGINMMIAKEEGNVGKAG